MAYIYMVRCQDASLYTGIAQDVGRRMREHYYKKKTGAKYTKSRQVESLEMVWKTDSWAGARKAGKLREASEKSAEGRTDRSS